MFGLLEELNWKIAIGADINELARLKDVSIVPELAKRLAGKGAAAEQAARALAELGDERGLAWLQKKTGKKAAPRPTEKREAEEKEAVDVREEIRLLKEEIRRLRKELDESLEILGQLLKEKAESKESEK